MFWGNLIRTNVDKIISTCRVYVSFNANVLRFHVYSLSSSDGDAQLINFAAQSIDRAVLSIDCKVNLNMIKHYNLEPKIQRTLCTQGVI